MITEFPPNAHLDEWKTLHGASEKLLSRESLELMLNGARSFEQVDKRWSVLNPIMCMYDYVRQQYAGAYEELLQHIFDKYLPCSGGLEFGCGGSPSFYKFIPESIRSNWVLSDLNEGSVQIARWKHPDAVVLCASYHQVPLKHGSQQLIAAFNALDMTNHHEAAMQQLGTLVSDGGYLFFMQDVIPNEIATAVREYQMTSREVIAGVNGKSVLWLGNSDAVDCRSYLLGQLHAVAESLDCSTVFHGIIEVSGTYAPGKIHLPSDYNSYVNLVSKPIAFYDPAVPVGSIFERIAVNVLIMKKATSRISTAASG